MKNGFIFKVSADLSAQSNGRWINKIKVLLLSHTFHLVFLIRVSAKLRCIKYIGVPLGSTLDYFIRIFFSSDISSKATLGAGLNLMHGHDIVIGSNVIIGENAKIFNGVTLGNKNTNTTIMEQPIIGDDVTICTGAKILGAIRIGNGSIIGANSVVTKDVPQGEVWAGVPAKKIKDNIQV